MGHDERYFNKPEEFDLDCFLENPHGIESGAANDPACRLNMLFRAGKHVCPGIALAKTSLVGFLWNSDTQV
jgi:cytochrome P450